MSPSPAVAGLSPADRIRKMVPAERKSPMPTVLIRVDSAISRWRGSCGPWKTFTFASIDIGGTLRFDTRVKVKSGSC
ncbi:hypothetical protein Apa02nite_099440 [Actinoplanes palleronii]|uniref:Uncharacterized protein n=1 Tax=Actinoplanes palleronii TaxID=113570 RepID=A0ABQ4BT30_9ACTN|nr:hypothetical protein Apa02nite_099440 [Actinoplanes palleronii]